MNRDMLADTLKGRTFIALIPTSGKLERKGIPGLEALAAEPPSVIIEVHVYGKQLLIRLANGYGIHSTLGMSGWWYPLLEDTKTLTGMAYMNGRPVPIKDAIEQAYKYSRVVISTDKGPTAVFCDMRNFGNMQVLTPEQLTSKANPMNKLGPDLLNEVPFILEQDPVGWHVQWETRRRDTSLAYRRKPVGEVLLDQEFACGLGNIYRAETLYLAGVNPWTKLGLVTEQQWGAIGVIAPNVLINAYLTQGVMGYPGAFLRHYLGWNLPDDHKYERHLCYGRKQDPKGCDIISETVGGRTMWYCPERQP